MVDDLVAVFVYLTNTAGQVNDALRRGQTGPHVPLARCVTSGLTRLPTYRGATILRATLTEDERAWYREGAAVVEWGFCGALTTARPGLPGNTDILIWSRTARRTTLMDAQVPDRVLFLPGTVFKVLHTSSGDRNQIMLRELAPSEVAADGAPTARVALDDTALTGLAAAAEAVRSARSIEPLPEAYTWAFHTPPGLIPVTAVPRSADADETVPPADTTG
ncbi:hypothetical protein [Streptomyces zhihengii]|uniref:Uncharacterized protein n=1 Tax=Streptomyces zhihengii TaxID=1818004 RepID=A0ABS2V426_9ACTN|nr:hypothetical protein [Streptomyces zhihengii]MBM9624490.1 hypothetical protein [Streptomyces zhihengii]